MRVLDTRLPGVVVVEPKVFRDERGSFLESWSLQRYRDAGLPAEFVQDNVSVSRRGVLRGLHYQEPNPQGKLVSVLRGEVFDVAVDIRVGSPTFGRWVGYLLSEENARQLYVPEGFAHGFVVLSESATVSYKCTSYYDPASEGTVLWSDPAIGIEWPVREPILSAKDRAGRLLHEIPAESFPRCAQV